MQTGEKVGAEAQTSQPLRSIRGQASLDPQSPGTPSWWHHSSCPEACVLPSRGGGLRNKDGKLAFLPPRKLLLRTVPPSFSPIVAPSAMRMFVWHAGVKW